MCDSGMGGDWAADGSLSFLHARHQVIRLAPLDPALASGYVWRRVFLRGRHQARGGFWG